MGERWACRAKGLGWGGVGATDLPSLLVDVGREVGQVNVFSRLEGNSHKMSSQIEQTGNPGAHGVNKSLSIPTQLNIDWARGR